METSIIKPNPIDLTNLPISETPTASTEVNPKQGFKQIPDPGTLDGPSGLSIGEETHVEKTNMISTSSLSKEETIELVR